jgi:hypothetical protein
MRRSIAVVGIAAVVSAGCGARPAAPAGGNTATNPPTRPAPTTSPSDSPGPVVLLNGIAARGVEPGCTVLQAGGRQYDLRGPHGTTITTVPLGVPIEVRAAVLKGTLSYCQQGTPVQVLQVHRR